MLDQLRRDITTRLDELVGEADKLRHALTALSPRQRNGTTATSPSASSQTPRQDRASSRTATTPKRAPGTRKTTNTARSSTLKSRQAASKAAGPASVRTAPGKTKTAVLAALANGEAMTASEVATRTGLGTATVSTTLSRLAKAGEITKASRGYRTNQPTTRASIENAGAGTAK